MHKERSHCAGGPPPLTSNAVLCCVVLCRGTTGMASSTVLPRKAGGCKLVSQSHTVGTLIKEAAAYHGGLAQPLPRGLKHSLVG